MEVVEKKWLGNGMVQSVLLFDWRMDMEVPEFVKFYLGEVVCIIMVDVVSGSGSNS